MTNCPLYNNSNLAYTGNKFNNPYTLIQKAGRKVKKSQKAGRKVRKSRKSRNPRKDKKSRKNTKRRK